MKKFAFYSGILSIMMAASAGCSKDDFKYGDISISPNSLTGMYRAGHNFCVQTDATGNIIEEYPYENNPGWPGSCTVFYEFAGDGRIVGYTRYRFAGDSE